MLFEEVKDKYLVIDSIGLNIYTFNEKASLILNEILNRKTIKFILDKFSDLVGEDFINEFINDMKNEEYLIESLEIKSDNKGVVDLSLIDDFQFDKKVIDKLNGNKVGKFNFLGGEPLMVFDDMIRLFEKTNKFSFVSFSTNGSYNNGISDEQCRKLLKFKDRLSIRVSINGFRDKHDKIVRKMGALYRGYLEMKYMLSSQDRIREDYFGGLAFNIKTLTYYELNKQSVKILELLSKGNDLDQISNILSEDYGINRDNIKLDVDDFVRQAIKDGLILEYNKNSNKNSIIKSEFKDLDIISPIEVYLYLTNKCNQKCGFYYNHSKIKDEFSKDDVYKIVDEAKELGVFTIGVLGGEPLVRKDLLLEMFDRCGNSINKVITTNASFDGGISRTFAEKLSKYKPLEINISLHRPNSKIHDEIVGYTGAFENVINSIKYLLEYNIIFY